MIRLTICIILLFCLSSQALAREPEFTPPDGWIIANQNDTSITFASAEFTEAFPPSGAATISVNWGTDQFGIPIDENNLDFFAGYSVGVMNGISSLLAGFSGEQVTPTVENLAEGEISGFKTVSVVGQGYLDTQVTMVLSDTPLIIILIAAQGESEDWQAAYSEILAQIN